MAALLFPSLTTAKDWPPRDPAPLRRGVPVPLAPREMHRAPRVSSSSSSSSFNTLNTTFRRVQLDRNFGPQENHCHYLGAVLEVAVTFQPSKAALQRDPHPLRVLIEAHNNPVRVAGGATGLYDFDFPVPYADIAPGSTVRVRVSHAGNPRGMLGTEEPDFRYEGPGAGDSTIAPHSGLTGGLPRGPGDRSRLDGCCRGRCRGAAGLG
ncbi:uncharacterized protein PG986_009895 [Apiospora aurea]|uniref:Uncharacterized protein n=1 Tax=Apiospora aurea TaxID=335848 RepID=A0ABR1Q8Z8_9PEZI